MELQDILGFGNASEKLLEMVQAGCGTVYEPIAIKRRAKAEAEAIGVIAQAIRENGDVPVAYADGSLSVDPSMQPLYRRAHDRLVYNAITEQQNIETIIELTEGIIVNKPDVPNTPVDERWARRFFTAAAEVSDEETQELWAKVLAGEIQKKGSFSLRTIDILRNLSQDEATLFQSFRKYMITIELGTFISSEPEVLGQHKINFADIIKLDDCGLMSSDIKTFTIHFEEIFQLENYIFDVCIDKKIFKQDHISMRGFFLTNAGVELMSLIDGVTDEEYLKSIIRKTMQSNRGITMGMYRKSSKDTPMPYPSPNLLAED